MERERKGLGDKMIQKSVGLGGLQQVRVILVLNKKENWGGEAVGKEVIECFEH